jgi:hypothetical protein
VLKVVPVGQALGGPAVNYIWGKMSELRQSDQERLFPADYYLIYKQLSNLLPVYVSGFATNEIQYQLKRNSLGKTVWGGKKRLELFYQRIRPKKFSIFGQKCKKNVDKFFWSGKFNY